MLINIISSASWTLQLGEFMEKTIVEMSAEAEIDIGRNRHKSGIKLSGQAQLIYINDINLNVTTRWRWAGPMSVLHAKLALFCWRSLDYSDSCATMPTNIRRLSSVYSASSEIKIQAVTTILNFLVNTTGYGFEIWHTVSHRWRLFNRNNHQKSNFMFPVRDLLKSIGARVVVVIGF